MVVAIAQAAAPSPDSSVFTNSGLVGMGAELEETSKTLARLSASSWRRPYHLYRAEKVYCRYKFPIGDMRADSGACDKSSQLTAGSVGDGGDRLSPARGCCQIGDDIGLLQIHHKHLWPRKATAI